MPPTPIPPAPTAADFRRALEGLPDDAPAALAPRGDAAFGHPILELRGVEARDGALRVGVEFSGIEEDDEEDEGAPLTQVGLVGVILRHLGRCGHGEARPRLVNAAIAAADGVLQEALRGDVPATPGSGLRAWLASDDTGLSSRAMARHLAPLVPLGVVVPGEKCRGDDGATPSDPADLGRCIRLLDAVPELRPLVPRMAEVSPAWGRLAARWDELERLYRRELPSGVGRRCYAAMMEALAEPAPAA